MRLWLSGSTFSDDPCITTSPTVSIPLSYELFQLCHRDASVIGARLACCTPRPGNKPVSLRSLRENHPSSTSPRERLDDKHLLHQERSYCSRTERVIHLTRETLQPAEFTVCVKNDSYSKRRKVISVDMHLLQTAKLRMYLPSIWYPE